MSALPPPPPGPPAWSGTPPSPAPPPATIARWRRAKPGWILLHLVIGVVIWIALVFVAAFTAAFAGRTWVEDSMNTDGALDAWTLILLVGSVAGWLLFVYLRTTLWIRWLVLGLATGIPTVALVVILLDRLPGA